MTQLRRPKPDIERSAEDIRDIVEKANLTIEELGPISKGRVQLRTKILSEKVYLDAAHKHGASELVFGKEVHARNAVEYSREKAAGV